MTDVAEKKPVGGWGLGVLLPAVTLAFLSADFALRLVPLERLSFRAWDPLKKLAPKDVPFPPNRKYVNPRAYGDLASIGNRPDLRQYRLERFTTDALGFRNPPDLLKNGPVDVLLLGDSFAVSSGVNDDETLAVQLGLRSGLKVYCGGGFRTTDHQVDLLLRNLGMTRGVVFQEMLVRGRSPDPPPARGKPVKLFTVDGFFEVSRLKIVLGQVHKRLQDNRILPNSFEHTVAVRTLSTGDTILFAEQDLPSGGETADGPPDVDVGYWLRMRERYRQKNLGFLVILAPNKFTVYRPHLRDNRTTPGCETAIIDGDERVLREAGIPVVNLTAALREAAARRIASRDYVYWLDDQHWNAEGARVAAEEIARVWKTLR